MCIGDGALEGATMKTACTCTCHDTIGHIVTGTIVLTASALYSIPVVAVLSLFLFIR
jgi:hypothetical protein